MLISDTVFYVPGQQEYTSSTTGGPYPHVAPVPLGSVVTGTHAPLVVLTTSHTNQLPLLLLVWHRGALPGRVVRLGLDSLGSIRDSAVPSMGLRITPTRIQDNLLLQLPRTCPVLVLW